MTAQESTSTERPLKGQTQTNTANANTTVNTAAPDSVTTNLDNIVNTLHYLSGSLQQYREQAEKADDSTALLDVSGIAGLCHIVQAVEQDAQNCFADYQSNKAATKAF
jgi:hypothetical protein